MQTIATSQNIKLQRNNNQWFILDGIHKQEFDKNTACLIYFDYVRQVIAGVDACVNFDIEK